MVWPLRAFIGVKPFKCAIIHDINILVGDKNYSPGKGGYYLYYNLLVTLYKVNPFFMRFISLWNIISFETVNLKLLSSNFIYMKALLFNYLF